MNKPNNTASILKWLPLLLIVVAGAAAWGQQQQQTTAQEKRIEQNEKSIRVLETGQATILERTKNIIDNQKTYQEESKATMREVLQELRRQR